MTVADVLDDAFRAWRVVLGSAVLAVVLVTGPIDLLSNLVIFRRNSEFLVGAGFGQPAFVDLTTMGLLLVMGIASTVATAYAAAVVIVLVLDADRGRRPRLGTALRAAVRPMGTILVALLLLAIAAVGAFIGVVVLAIIPFVGFIVVLTGGPIAFAAGTALVALVVPIAVMEAEGPIATLGRAWWVLRVRFWRTVGITLLVLLVLLGVSLGLSVALQFLATVTGPAAWLVLAVSSILLSVVQIPVLSIAALLVYLDARMLREGYDLEVRLAHVAAV